MRALLATTALAGGMLLAASGSAWPKAIYVPPPTSPPTTAGLVADPDPRFSINFGSGPLGNLGTSHTWTDNGASVTATAYGPGNPHLFVENHAPEDVGLGLTNSRFGDNEVTSGSWEQFQFSPTLTSLKFSANSTNPQDTFAWYGSNTPGTLGTFLFSGTTDNPVNLSAYLGEYAELDLTALPLSQQPQGSNDTILAAGFSGTFPTPASEPGTLAILGGGLLGLGLLRRRSRGAW